MSDRDPWWKRTLLGCLEPLIGIVGAVAAWAFVRSLYRRNPDRPAATPDEAAAPQDDEAQPVRC